MSVVTVTVDEYSVTFDNGRLTATRYGKPWRDLLGDNLVLALMRRILELQQCESFTQSAMLNDEFREQIATQIRHKLASVLVARFGGELEKQVNVLKSDPTTRARITLAIEEIIKVKQTLAATA
jgi:hypothetical protein